MNIQCSACAFITGETDFYFSPWLTQILSAFLTCYTLALQLSFGNPSELSDMLPDPSFASH